MTSGGLVFDSYSSDRFDSVAVQQVLVLSSLFSFSSYFFFFYKSVFSVLV